MSGTTVKHFNDWAWLYQVLWDNPPVLKGIRKAAVDAMALEKGDKVVEPGCGPGSNIPHLREAVGPEGEIVMIDKAPEMVKQARKRAEKNGWENVEVIEADACDPSLDRDFDAVLFSYTLGVLDNPLEAIEFWSQRIENGRMVLAMNPVDQDTILPLETLFRWHEYITMPPAFKFRYEEPVIDNYLQLCQDAKQKLESISTDYREKHFLKGLIGIYSGKIE